MKTLGHLLKFELRRHRWSLVVYVGVMLAMASHGWLAAGDPPEAGLDGVVGRTAFATVTSMLFMGVWASLIAALMQAEPAFGRRAAWTVRPIGWGTMLASRFAAAVAFVLAPVWLLQFGALLVLGGSFGAALDTSSASALALGLFSLPVMLLAALSPSFGRFWLLLVAGVFGLSLVVTGVAAATRSLPGDVGGAKIFLGLMTAGVGSVLLLVAAYARRTHAGVTLGAAALLLAVAAIVAFWKWPLPGVTTSSRGEVVPTVAAPAEVKFRATLRPASGKQRRSEAVQIFVEGAGGFHRLRTVEARAFPAAGAATKLETVRPNRRLGVRAAVAALDGAAPRLIGADEADVLSPTLWTDLRERAADFARIEGAVTVERLRWQPLGELAAQVGSRWSRDSAELVVERVTLGNDRILVGVRTSWVARRFGDATEGERAVRGGLFVLLNRARREAVVLDRAAGAGTFEMQLVPGFRRAQVQFSVPRMEAAESWLADAVLVIVREEAIERFNLPFELTRTAAPEPERP